MPAEYAIFFSGSLDLCRTEEGGRFFNRQFVSCKCEDLWPCVSVSSSDPFSHVDSFRNAQPLQVRSSRTDPISSLFPPQARSYQIKDASLNFGVFPGSANACSGSFSYVPHMHDSVSTRVFYWIEVGWADQRHFSSLSIHEQITSAKITGREGWRTREEK